jgi:uroporphyrin-III C-methyltransferase/precorrin-2 dehydrogenase/sirohydrochlorin ferrochelatase
MGALARLPVFLSLDGKRAVVAGGSPAAAWKAELLSASGARVEVYATDICDELQQLAADPPRGAIVINRCPWSADALKNAAVAIGAFEDDNRAAAFASAARAAGVPVNVIDKPAFCDFSFGAIVNRSPLVIGISTDGAAPVFAQAVRAKLEALLPKGFADSGRRCRALARRAEARGAVIRGTTQVLAAIHCPCGRQSRPRTGPGRFRQLHR